MTPLFYSNLKNLERESLISWMPETIDDGAGTGIYVHDTIGALI